MSEKTIWPEWRNYLCPTREDGKWVIVYRKDEKEKFLCYLFSQVSDNMTWCKEPAEWEKRYPENWYDILATPEECEARKKGLEDNPWIPGNEPEKEMEYEITFEDKKVSVGYYGKQDNEWFKCYVKWKTQKWYKPHIIAYKPLELSEPYVPPGRELRCPFCDSGKCEIDEHEDFGCYSCGAHLPVKSKYDIFEIYDKLNPLP